MSHTLFDDYTSATAKKYIHKSAKDVLYSYVATKYYAETAQGLDKGSLIGQSKEVYAWWIPVLISIDVLSGLLIAFWMFMALRRTFKKDKVISNTEQYKAQ